MDKGRGMELGIMDGNTYGRIVGMKEDEPETLEMTQKSSGVTYTVNSHLQCLDCPTCDNDGSVTHPSLPSFYLLIVVFGSIHLCRLGWSRTSVSVAGL